MDLSDLRFPDRVEQWPVERLVPYQHNARTHSDSQVGQIADSIRRFGFTAPLLVDDGGRVIAGHGRLMAARVLGLSQVPVLVLDHLSDAERRAYIVADNKLALNAGWDEELLAKELKELEGLGFDLALTGFSEKEINTLFDELVEEAEGLSDKDEAPAPSPHPISRQGDLWILGSHRLTCGDATRLENYARLLEGAQAAMVFTDPPYNVAYSGHQTNTARGIMNDDLGERFPAFLSSVCANMLAVTDGSLYICMSSSELDTLKSAFTQAGGHWSTFVVWAKNTFTLGRADYQRQYEPILYGWREGTKRYWCGARDQGDVWFINKPVSNDLHPTMKPVELVERAVRNSSKRDDLVLDPFAGSGSTLIACESLGRRARLIELDPAYCDVIIRRWQTFTGNQAIREIDGIPFDALVGKRDDG